MMCFVFVLTTEVCNTSFSVFLYCYHLFIRALSALEDDFEDPPRDPEKFISNPLAAFQLMRKLKQVWAAVWELIEGRRAKGLRRRTRLNLS